ncbi:unnamed protein product [Rotaria sp. Silwood2]|nr:unnamed protein product [Rotaria sp. Silwood2]
MASICIVKFDGDGVNSVCLVSESCLQSSKNVKVKLNGDYLFVHRSDRQRRLRGKLLFKGTLEECEEYCEGDSCLTVDKSSWLSNSTLESNIIGDVSKHSTTESKKNTINQKQSKTNPSKATMKRSSEKEKPFKNKQAHACGKKNQKSNEIRSNDDNELSTSNAEASDLVDLSNNDSTNNNMSAFDRQSQAMQSKDPKSLTTETNPVQCHILSDNNTDDDDDELFLPRHITLELKNNRKQILELENQLKEMKRMSIPFPTPQEADYLRRVMAVVEMRTQLATSRAVNCGQLLGLSNIELLEATGNGRLPWKKIVVNLLKACFKNIDLQYENYTTLRNGHEELIDNILSYVKALCPTVVITDSQFSACISGKCHHMKSDNKKKANKLAAVIF